MTKDEIYEFIVKQKTSLISSVDEQGYPATRALIQPVLVAGNDIYFATYTSSRKVKHYRNHPKACVYFYEKAEIFRELRSREPWRCVLTSLQRSGSGNRFSTNFIKKESLILTTAS